MLSPSQLGALAHHVSYAIRRHPGITHPGYHGEMQNWEKELSKNVNADLTLPDYDEVQTQDAEILETLIEYFS